MSKSIAALARSLWAWFTGRGMSLLLFVGSAAIVAFAIGATAEVSRTAMDDRDEASAVAARVSQAMDSYLSHIVRQVKAIANMPHIRGFADLQSPMRSPAEDERIDEWWRTQAQQGLLLVGERVSPNEERFQRLVDRVLSNEVSTHLKELVNIRGGVIREILLADRYGRLVAASGPADDYQQADEGWWRAAMAGNTACDAPHGCAFADDIGYDASARIDGFAVAVPVIGGARSVAGALKVVVDPQEIEPLMSLAAVGRRMEIGLIRRDGTYVLNPGKHPFGSVAEVPGDVRKLLSQLARSQPLTVQLDSATIPVRALSGPQGDVWAVAVREQRDESSRRRVGTSAAIALVMFPIAAASFARWRHNTEGSV